MTQNAHDTLDLIDGSGFIFRAFHALPPMTRGDGTPVNAVYGFCAMLAKLLGARDKARSVVIFDAARRTFRNDIYPAYKAHRPDPPPELVPQFALIREATQAFGLRSVELPGFEADDLIAAYAAAAEAKGIPVRVISADKDLMQLIRPGVTLFDPMKNIPLGEAEVEAKFGVPPSKVIDVQALAGDSTDNVPGVPGIGVKTAAELIRTYGDLETLLARAGEIKQPKRRAALIDNAELARISKQLVTLDAAAPLPLPLDELALEPSDGSAWRAFLAAQGFRSLLARLGGSADLPTPPLPPSRDRGPSPQPSTNADPLAAEALSRIPAHYELVQNRAALERWVRAAREQGYVAIDTETTSLIPSRARLVGVSLALAPGKACYIPVGHVDPANDGALFAAPPPTQISADDLDAVLGPLLADDATLKIAHNMKYDFQVFAARGLETRAFDDSMLMSYALEAGLHGHGLDELALRHFGHKMIAFSDVTGTGRAQITFDRVPLEKATTYAAEDADFTLRLWLLLRPRLASEHVMRVYARTDKPLIPVVAAMETAGIKIDAPMLAAQGGRLSARLAELESAIHTLAGHPFNIASPKQLGEVLFTELGLPGGVRGKNGAFATGHEVLLPLAEAGNEIVEKLLAARALAKLKSTYIDALPQQIDRDTGRIHTSFSLVGAATGRLSSTDPNLQNIPIRTEEGRAIRRAFVAKEGCLLLSVDYSQIELRLAASLAGISALIGAFHDGADIHALTASQVFGIPLATLPPEKRRQAKAINFGIIYGISGYGLAKQLGCAPSEAAAFIKAYLDRFHELRDWMEATKTFAHEHGYVETIFGRRIHIQGIHEKNGMRRAGAERQAINAPLQGTAADLMKRAMIRMPGALAKANLAATMLLQVHDELVFEVPEAEIDATAALVKSVMESASLPARTLKVPLTAEANYAKDWASAH